MTPQRYRKLRWALDRRQPDLTVISENVHKPHNFAAVLRTCDAVGVVEASAIWTLDDPVHVSEAVSGNVGKWIRVRCFKKIEEAVSRARKQDMQILAAHLSPQAVDYREVDYTRPTALILGQEKEGVTSRAAALSDRFVSIPMKGIAASLNVSVAAAVILYEAQRQRQQAGFYDTPRLSPEAYQRLLFEWAYPEIESYCRRKNIPYPELREDGQIVGWEQRG